MSREEWSLLTIVDFSAGNEESQDAGTGNFDAGDGHDVVVEHDEIGLESDGNAAFVAFLKVSFGDPTGDGAQGLLACERVGGLPTTVGVAVEVLACHGCIESVEGADVFDGEVGAVDEPPVLLEQALICVGVSDAAAKTVCCPGHVGCGMSALYGWYNIVFII